MRRDLKATLVAWGPAFLIAGIIFAGLVIASTIIHHNDVATSERKCQ